MCYVTTFAAEEAKVAVHSSLSLLLGQLPIFSKFGREVGLVVAGGPDQKSSRAIGGPRLIVVGARVAFVGAGVVFLLSVWLLGFMYC